MPGGGGGGGAERDDEEAEEAVLKRLVETLCDAEFLVPRSRKCAVSELSYLSGLILGTPAGSGRRFRSLHLCPESFSNSTSHSSKT